MAISFKSFPFPFEESEWAMHIRLTIHGAEEQSYSSADGQRWENAYGKFMRFAADGERIFMDPARNAALQAALIPVRALAAAEAAAAKHADEEAAEAAYIRRLEYLAGAGAAELPLSPGEAGRILAENAR